MSKVKTGSVWKPEGKPKNTSQTSKGSRVKFSSMNKSKKRGFKKYRGQGR